jgi:DNA-binding NarL/FixJ family response regulator
MPSKISAVIIDRDKIARNALETALMPYARTIVMLAATDNFRDGLTIMHNCTPDVVFLGVADLRQGVEAVQLLTRRYPRVSIIAGSYENDPALILALMRAGAMGYLLQPFTEGELHIIIQKVARFLAAPATGAIQTVGRIISVYNPSGGRERQPWR